MKKKSLSLMILFVLFCSLIPFSFIPAVHAVDVTEDFETGTVGVFDNKYTPYGVDYWSVVSDEARDTYSLKYNDVSSGAWDRRFSDDNTFWDNDTADSISWWIWVDTGAYYLVRYVNNLKFRCSIAFDSGSILCWNGTANTNAGSYENQEWILVRTFTNGNYPGGTFDVFAYDSDGNLFAEAEGVAMYDQSVGSGNERDVVLTGSLAGQGIVYFDDCQSPAEDAPVPIEVTADLEPDSIGADWVFSEWRYYTFTVTIPSSVYTNALDFVYIGMNELRISNGTLNFASWSDSGNWSALSDYWLYHNGREPDAVRVREGSWSSDENETVITFPLYFTRACLDIWKDNCVDVLVWWNETSTGTTLGWLTGATDLFRVYNEGGFSLITQTTGTPGESGTLPGGRDFSMFAYAGSYVYKDLWWRDLQHIKVMPEVHFSAGLETFQLYYGFDFMTMDGAYHTGLNLRLEPDAVSYTGVFASNVWINMTASWYYNNTLIKEEYLYMFYHGDVYTTTDLGRWGFWVDLWFDNTNASSVMGGRVNAYEFPMKDSSGAWLRWLSSNWGIMDNVSKQSECLVPLNNTAGSLLSAEDVEFVIVHSALNVYDEEAGQYIAIVNFPVFDTTNGGSPLKGIATPPWDDTQMPAMKNTGVLGAIWSMFQGIGAWLSENILFGGLNLWGNFVAFLDTIAGWLGAPKFFSNLFAYLGELFGNFVSGVGYSLELIYQFFVMIGLFIGSFITTLGELVLSIGNTLAGIIDIMGGTIGGAGNLWNQLGISSWLTLAMIFYPIYLIILWEERGMDAVMNQLTMIFGIATWLWHFFITLGTFVINLVSSLIESIPIAE